MKWSGKKKEKRALSPEEHAKNRQLAENAAKYAMFASNTQPQSQAAAAGGRVGNAFDISNAQKIAAYNLLVNTRDE